MLHTPNPLYTALEQPRFWAELCTLGIGRHSIKRDIKTNGQGILIIPGYMANDCSTYYLTAFLRKQGYYTKGWKMGRNLGLSRWKFEQLLEDISRYADKTGGPITLMGHSLGGIYARELARAAPEGVAQVISVGSPINSYGPHTRSAKRLINELFPSATSKQRHTDYSAPPSVKFTSIYSKSDGVINWRSSHQTGQLGNYHNRVVIGSHSGLTVNLQVWKIILELLDEEQYKDS